MADTGRSSGGRQGRARRVRLGFRRRGRLAPLALALLAAAELLSAGCRSGGAFAGQPPTARAWAEGPVRWLMLPDEVRAFRRVRSNPAALAFIEEFWRRRDPTPDSPGNPFAQEFFERVQAADLLYDDEGVPGSLTDRGRALVLLGPPSLIRVTSKTAASWEPLEGRGRRPHGTRQVRLEVWGYQRGDLSERLLALLDEGRGGDLELTFVVEAERVRLSAGEGLLVLAAEAAVTAR